MITADESFARVRMLWSVLTGTVDTSRVTHLLEAARVRIETDSGPMVLAVDGETMPGVRVAEFALKGRALTYYSPREAD
jgi:hypothetical protein